MKDRMDRMGKFKEDIIQDIENVFANRDEFFEEHTVNGKKMLIMVDGNESLGKTRFQGAFHEGMQAEQIVIYAKASEFGRKPAYGSRITVDGVSFLVGGAANECGMLRIIMESLRGNAK